MLMIQEEDIKMNLEASHTTRHLCHDGHLCQYQDVSIESQWGGLSKLSGKDAFHHQSNLGDILLVTHAPPHPPKMKCSVC